MISSIRRAKRPAATSVTGLQQKCVHGVAGGKRRARRRKTLQPAPHTRTRHSRPRSTTRARKHAVSVRQEAEAGAVTTAAGARGARSAGKRCSHRRARRTAQQVHVYVHQLVARSPAWAARLQEKRVLVVAAAAPRAAQLEALVIATHARATFHVVRHHPEQSSTPPACAAKHAQPGTSRRHGRRARGAAAGPGTRRAPCAGTGSPGRILQRRGTTPRGVVTVHVQLTSCVPTRPCYSALLCSPARARAHTASRPARTRAR